MQFVTSNVTNFVQKFITKFGDSQNLTPNLVIIFVTNSSQKTLGVLPPQMFCLVEGSRQKKNLSLFPFLLFLKLLNADSTHHRIGLISVGSCLKIVSPVDLSARSALPPLCSLWSLCSLVPCLPLAGPPASKACSNHGNQSCYERERKLSLEKGPQTTWCLREGWVRTKARVLKGDPC